jgi:2-phosphosulfolactate phosphatase
VSSSGHPCDGAEAADTDDLVAVPQLVRDGLRLRVTRALLAEIASASDAVSGGPVDTAAVVGPARRALALAGAAHRLAGRRSQWQAVDIRLVLDGAPSRLTVPAGSPAAVLLEIGPSAVRPAGNGPDTGASMGPVLTAALTAALTAPDDDPDGAADRMLAALYSTVDDPETRALFATALGLAGLPAGRVLEAETTALLWMLAHPEEAVPIRALRRVGRSIGAPPMLPRIADAARGMADPQLRDRLRTAYHLLGRRTLVTRHPAAVRAVKRSTYAGRYWELDRLLTDLITLLDEPDPPDRYLGVDVRRWRTGAGDPVLLVDEGVSDGQTTAELAGTLRRAGPGRPVLLLGRDVNLEETVVWADQAVGVVDGTGRCAWLRELPVPPDQRAGDLAALLERRWAEMPPADRRRNGFRWLDPGIDQDPPTTGAAHRSVQLDFAPHDVFAEFKPPADLIRVCGLLYERLRAEADAGSYFDRQDLRRAVRQLGRGLRDGGLLVISSVVDSADDSRVFGDVDVFQRVGGGSDAGGRGMPRLLRVHREGLGMGPAGEPVVELEPATGAGSAGRAGSAGPADGAGPRSDVWTGWRQRFDPWPATRVHVEWGHVGAGLAAARGDDVVIVDVLSFSTTLTMAAERSIDCYVYSGPELAARGGREAVAAALGAVAAVEKRAAAAGRFSLSPASLVDLSEVPAALFTSLNGALAVSAAEGAPFLAVGCLRNRQAVARLVADRLWADPTRRVSVVACGEHWSSVSEEEGLRPCLEDLLGAGGICVELAALGLPGSPEAAAAGAAFAAASGLPPEAVSARELIAAGFAADVRLAGEVDVTDAVPVRAADPTGRRFTATRPDHQPS